MPRRDRRSGQQTGTLTRVDGGVQVDIKWGDPYAGAVRMFPAVRRSLSMFLPVSFSEWQIRAATMCDVR